MEKVSRMRFRIVKCKRGQRGFTLIEVLLAVALIGILGTAVPGALSMANRSTMTSNRHITAESLARSQMDSIQNQTYDSVNATPVYNVISDVPSSYSIVTPFATRLDPMGDGTANDDGLQMITVTVKQNEETVFTLVDYKVNYHP